MIRKLFEKGATAFEVGIFLAQNTGAAKALATWPKFSVTSFAMVSRLRAQGISPWTVLDVGANVGQFAVAASKLWPASRVHSFEAVPECAKKLRKNTSGLENVSVYPFALGKSEGEISFHVNSQSHSSSALPLADAHLSAFPEARESREISVRVRTLDETLSGTQLAGPVLLKMDVQGYEPQVLAGAMQTLGRVEYVVLEASFKPLYKGEKLFMEINETMEKLGFRFERPVGWLQSPETAEILQMDALFVKDDRSGISGDETSKRSSF